MKLRIHFAVGSTAMAREVELTDVADFRTFTRNLNAAQRDGSVTSFINSHGGGSWAIAARSIVFAEEIQ